MNDVPFEKKIVAAALSSRLAHARIAAASSGDDTYTPYTSFLLKLCEKYYARDTEALRVDAGILAAQIEAELPEKNQPIYINYLKECAGLDISAVNVADIIVAARQKHLGNRLATALLENKDSDKVAKLMEEYGALEDEVEKEEEEDYNNVSVAQVVEDSTNQAGLIKLLPAELDRACKGKTRRGHHFVLAARPETGKTGCTLTLTWGFALQGLDTILFGNEEPVKDTILRAQCCFTGMTEEQILENPRKAQELLDKRGWKHVRFIPLNPGTPREIDKYLSRYKPSIFVVDQIRNLNVGGETRVNQLEMAATAMRNLGKKHECLAISVTQAGDSATNKLVLDMNDIDFSNTGIPATADLMIMIGVNKDYEANGMRMISTPKNKIGGVHAHFPVRINTQISRYEDV